VDEILNMELVLNMYKGKEIVYVRTKHFLGILQDGFFVLLETTTHDPQFLTSFLDTLVDF
jgi:hypothetical protein